MTTHMAIEAKDEGMIAIPARILLDALKNLPEQPLTFTIDEKTYAIEISSDYGKYKLTGHNGEDFPKAPALENAQSFAMTSESLGRAISKTLFATGNDDMRPVMSGVYFEVNESNIRFVATDAHKLVRYSLNDVNGGKAATFIVPKKPLNLLKGILSSLKSDVQIQYNENNAIFSFDNVTLMCRL